MTVAEYFLATILVALILCGVLGLLTQENSIAAALTSILSGDESSYGGAPM